MDESYTHQNYARHDDSLYDPTDANITKSKHKGRRLCFIAAIVAEDPSIPGEERKGAYSVHLLKQTIGIFEGGKQTKDYHGMFNTDYFVAWMARQLDTLDDMRISNSVIVMDNAKYYVTKPSTLPKRNNKKQALQAACDAFQLPYDAVDTKSIL
ncbi:hypothetical protein BBJ28_00024351 [Nothophytophthora sp. Chile5]|nr:hypothetical protein BBJ28_00024351 [Nothophytophthora sp. Chile5]